VWPKSSGPIYGRFINSQCQPEGDIFTIASAPAGGPNIAFDGTNYLVVWFTGVYPALELYGHMVSTQGTLVGSPISIASGSGCHRWADIAFDGTNYLVIWQTGENNVGQKIYGQFIGMDGSLIGDTFMICDDTYQERWWPAIAAADTNFITVWGQGYGSACNIWGNVDVPITGIEEDPGYTIRDAGFILSAYPNPFNEKTSIMWQTTDNSHVNLKIYSVTGRLVKEYNHWTDQQCIWKGTDDFNKRVPEGVYILKFQAGDHTATEKLLLIR
jgi:hypothetical protein